MKEFLTKLVTPIVPDDIGEIYVNWQFPEYVRRQKTAWWYVAAIGFLAICLVYAIATANYLFAVIMGLATFIIIFQHFQAPRSIPVVIGEDGVIVDRRFYPYKNLKSFSIIYEPPQSKYLFLDFQNDFKRSFAVPLEDANPLKIREALLNYIEENLERDSESFHETLEKMMRMR
jgi:hypothetical protein